MWRVNKFVYFTDCRQYFIPLQKQHRILVRFCSFTLTNFVDFTWLEENTPSINNEINYMVSFPLFQINSLIRRRASNFFHRGRICLTSMCHGQHPAHMLHQSVLQTPPLQKTLRCKTSKGQYKKSVTLMLQKITTNLSLNDSCNVSWVRVRVSCSGMEEPSEKVLCFERGSERVE